MLEVMMKIIFIRQDITPHTRNETSIDETFSTKSENFYTNRVCHSISSTR